MTLKDISKNKNWMIDIRKISGELTKTLKDNDFQDTLSNLGEVTLDNLLESGVLKEIPILGTIIGLSRSKMTIQDRLFTKKLLTFLFQLKDTNIEERKKQVDKIEKDSNYQTKVGEKLLFIIDKCEDDEKARYIGKLFQCFIQEKINYDDFLRASRCIELTHLEDLKRFIKEKWDSLEMEEAGDLIGSGLMYAIYYAPKMSYDSLEGGELKVRASYIGKKIQELLKDV
jgi:hypothetical protein